MKRIIFLYTLLGFMLFLLPHNTKAAELITNGGFETGDFTGWTVSNPATFFRPWTVSASGAGGSNASPGTPPPPYVPYPTATTVISGAFNAWNGVSEGAGQSQTMTQDITIPAGVNARISWQDKYQMNYTQFCSTDCGTATYAVEILNTSNVLQQTLYIVNTLTNTNTNTGWVNHVVNISFYQGRTIRIRFRTTTTQSLKGPGQLEVDNVSILTFAPSAANVSLGGRVMTSEGVGISRATVTMTDGAGNTRTALTNGFGYYHFDDATAGDTCILTVKSKQYLFPDSPRAVNVTDSLKDVDFIASP